VRVFVLCLGVWKVCGSKEFVGYEVVVVFFELY